VLRVVARALSILVLAFTLFIFIVETRAGVGPTQADGTRREDVQGALLLVALAGLVVGWRWELLGGALTVVATVLFVAIHLIATGELRLLMALVYLGVPGVLFVLTGLVSRDVAGSQRPSSPTATGKPPPRPVG
jgi:hypothetical protein